MNKNRKNRNDMAFVLIHIGLCDCVVHCVKYIYYIYFVMQQSIAEVVTWIKKMRFAFCKRVQMFFNCDKINSCVLWIIFLSRTKFSINQANKKILWFTWNHKIAKRLHCLLTKFLYDTNNQILQTNSMFIKFFTY